VRLWQTWRASYAGLSIRNEITTPAKRCRERGRLSLRDREQTLAIPPMFAMIGVSRAILFGGPGMSRVNRRTFLTTAGTVAATASARAGEFKDKPVKFRLGIVTYNIAAAWDVPTILKVCKNVSLSPVERTLEQIGKALVPCGRAAEDAGVEIWVEVHGPGTSEPCHMKTIMEHCGHAKVGLTWNSNPTDIKHGSVAEAFRLLRPWVR